MRICTGQEVMGLGFDPAISRGHGDIKTVETQCAVQHDARRLGYLISVDERIHSLDARRSIPLAISHLGFKSVVLEGMRTKRRFSDMSKIDGFTLDCTLLGVDTLVSEMARDKLVPFLGDECSFIPVVVEGAPWPYCLMWLHRLFDAFDTTRSLLRDDDGRKRLSCGILLGKN